MKLPPKNTRPRLVLMTLLAEPATIYQGMERHGDFGIGEKAIRDIYMRLVLDDCLDQTDMIFRVSASARAVLAPSPPVVEEEGIPAAPAYHGNWLGPALTAASARRAGAAFGLDWIRP